MKQLRFYFVLLLVWLPFLGCEEVVDIETEENEKDLNKPGFISRLIKKIKSIFGLGDN